MSNEPSLRPSLPPEDLNKAAESEELEFPPEDAPCHVHDERAALILCPSCRRAACIACWHQSVKRCHACLMLSPLDYSEPIGMEAPQRSWLYRSVHTFVQALSPIRTAPGFSVGETKPAIVFFASSFIPLALLSGVIPYTHQLQFGPSFSLIVRSHQGLPFDIARSMLLGLLIAALKFAALTVPFVSLANGFADRGKKQAPLRLMLYRGWLVPASTLLMSVLAFSLPAMSLEEDAPSSAILLLQILAQMPLLLLLASMRAVARMGSGNGPMASFAAVLIPFLLLVPAEVGVQSALSKWLPAEMVRPTPSLEAPAQNSRPSNPAPSPTSPSRSPTSA